MNLDEYARMFAAEDDHWWYVGMREITLGMLNGQALGGRILDAGCGTGGLLARLDDQGSAAGVDLASAALQLARRRGLRQLCQASIETLPFAAETFDLVTSMDVLYHLAVHEDTAALREFRRVLRPGGWVLVKVPAFEALRGQHDRTVHTRHRYTVGELRDKLTQAGFQVERATYANTLLLPMAAAKRLLEGVLPLAEEGESDVAMPSAGVNRLLTGILRLEAAVLRRRDLPVGLSAVALARRV